MLSRWYKLLDKEKTNQEPFSFQETAQQKETISWDVGTRSFLRHHLRCQDFRKRNFSRPITKFSLCPPGLRDAQRARPRKRLCGEVGLRYGVRWLQQVLVGRDGEQRYCFVLSNCIGFLQGGNRNNFETKEECDEICVHPEGKRVFANIQLLL